MIILTHRMKNLVALFITLAVGFYVTTLAMTIIDLRKDIHALQVEQAKRRTDMDALWLNQAEMLGTVNSLVTDVEQLQDNAIIFEDEYYDPTPIPVSPSDNRF